MQTTAAYSCAAAACSRNNVCISRRSQNYMACRLSFPYPMVSTQQGSAMVRERDGVRSMPSACQGKGDRAISAAGICTQACERSQDMTVVAGLWHDMVDVQQSLKMLLITDHHYTCQEPKSSRSKLFRTFRTHCQESFRRSGPFVGFYRT